MYTNYLKKSSFLGISIISDIFMCAIEKITSKTTEIQIAGDADSPSDVIEVAAVYCFPPCCQPAPFWGAVHLDLQKKVGILGRSGERLTEDQPFS